MKQPVYCMIDLSTKEVLPYPISKELFLKHLGGKILGVKLLTDLTEKGLDVFSPESVVIINTGPMNDTGAPCTSRFNMTFKNALTNGIASSNCGGSFGIMLKRAGFDGLIIKGKAETPTTIVVEDGKIKFESAEDLWGLDAEKTQEKLPSAYGKLVIGPAGENLVRYASCVSGERVAGRCGSGAVLGAKNVKAIVAYGTKKQSIYHKDEFLNYIRKWTKFIKNHPMTGNSLPKYGSASLVNKANASRALPTKNFQEGYFEDAEKISGEYLAENFLVKNSGCISCPIRCERRVKVAGKEVKGPEFETVGFFGSNILSDDINFINEVNYYADILGFDTISLGGSIAYAMELKQKGIADYDLEFGKTDNIIEIMHKIANREGKFRDLGEGSKRMSEQYDQKEFAIHSKGLELASYEPRRSVGMGLGYATANRGGCHLNGGYLALLESVGVVSLDPQNPKSKPELTIFMQNIMESVSAAGFCFFSLQTMIPSLLFKTGPLSTTNKVTAKVMLNSKSMVSLLLKNPKMLKLNMMSLIPQSKAIACATGLKMTTGQMLEIGNRGFTLERLYNIREGLTKDDDSLPDRLTKTPQVEGQIDTVVPLEQMLKTYYKLRQWDEFGVPTKELLDKLGI